MELKEVDGLITFLKYIFQGMIITKAGALMVTQRSSTGHCYVLR